MTKEEALQIAQERSWPLYDPKRICAKCASGNVVATYVAESEYGPYKSAAYYRDRMEECILRTCRNCQHNWCEEPLNGRESESARIEREQREAAARAAKEVEATSVGGVSGVQGSRF